MHRLWFTAASKLASLLRGSPLPALLDVEHRAPLHGRHHRLSSHRFSADSLCAPGLEHPSAVYDAGVEYTSRCHCVCSLPRPRGRREPRQADHRPGHCGSRVTETCDPLAGVQAKRGVVDSVRCIRRCDPGLSWTEVRRRVGAYDGDPSSRSRQRLASPATPEARSLLSGVPIRPDRKRERRLSRVRPGNSPLDPRAPVRSIEGLISVRSDFLEPAGYAFSSSIAAWCAFCARAWRTMKTTSAVTIAKSTSSMNRIL